MGNPKLEVITSYEQLLHSKGEFPKDPYPLDPNISEIFLVIKERVAFYNGRLDSKLKEMGLEEVKRERKRKSLLSRLKPRSREERDKEREERLYEENRKRFVGGNVEVLYYPAERVESPESIWNKFYYTLPAITIRTKDKERGEEIRFKLARYWNFISF